MFRRENSGPRKLVHPLGNLLRHPGVFGSSRGLGLYRAGCKGRGLSSKAVVGRAAIPQAVNRSRRWVRRIGGPCPSMSKGPAIGRPFRPRYIPPAESGVDALRFALRTIAAPSRRQPRLFPVASFDCLGIVQRCCGLRASRPRAAPSPRWDVWRMPGWVACLPLTCLPGRTRGSGVREYLNPCEKSFSFGPLKEKVDFSHFHPFRGPKEPKCALY